MALPQPAPALKPHALNTDFVWPERPCEGLKALTADQIGQYNRDGFTIAPQLISGAALAALTQAIDACEAAEPDSILTMADGYTLTYEAERFSFSRNLIVRDDTVREFALSQPIAAIMHDLLGPAVRLYWDQAVYKKPGEQKEFPYHQDNGYTFVAPQAYVTLWLALNDATLDNGCPWVIPGVHTQGTLQHDNAPYGVEVSGINACRDQAVSCPLNAGDAVIFSSLTPHMTGANVTGGTRKAFILQYMPDGAQRHDADGTVTLDDPQLNPLVTVA